MPVYFENETKHNYRIICVDSVAKKELFSEILLNITHDEATQRASNLLKLWPNDNVTMTRLHRGS